MAPSVLSMVRGISLLCCVLAATSCADYDPPPESELVIPDSGKWFAQTPVELRFTEAVVAETVAITIWPRTLDDDGELLSGTQPIAEACTVGQQSPCDGVVLSLNDANDRLSIDHGTLLDGVQGQQLIVEVHPGLEDTAGRQRKVKDWFAFSITPDCALPDPSVEATHLNLALANDVWALFADLTDTLSGIYLQMFVNVSIDRKTGLLWMAGTVATNTGDPGTTDPANLEVYNDDKGWTVFMTGKMGTKADGTFCVSTDTTDLKVKVLGLIDVELKEFKLDFGLELGTGSDGRDELIGFMTSSQALMNGTDLGAAAAPVVAYSSLATEVPDGLPRLCDATPCTTMDQQGGDCQLARPWEPGPNDACEQ